MSGLTASAFPDAGGPGPRQHSASVKLSGVVMGCRVAPGAPSRGEGREGVCRQSYQRGEPRQLPYINLVPLCQGCPLPGQPNAFHSPPDTWPGLFPQQSLSPSTNAISAQLRHSTQVQQEEEGRSALSGQRGGCSPGAPGVAALGATVAMAGTCLCPPTAAAQAEKGALAASSGARR